MNGGASVCHDGFESNVMLSRRPETVADAAAPSRVAWIHHRYGHGDYALEEGPLCETPNWVGGRLNKKGSS